MVGGGWALGQPSSQVRRRLGKTHVGVGPFECQPAGNYTHAIHTFLCVVLVVVVIVQSVPPPVSLEERAVPHARSAVQPLLVCSCGGDAAKRERPVMVGSG